MGAGKLAGQGRLRHLFAVNTQDRYPMWDEEEPPKPRRLAPLPLDSLGIDELKDYIAELQAEIGRVQATIQQKQAHRGDADRFFRSPGPGDR